MIKGGTDPPTNIRDEWICARAYVDGSQCLQRVTTPGAACVVHNEGSSIVPGGGIQIDE